MTRLARIWRRFLGTWDVVVFTSGQDAATFQDEDVVWLWHFRGVLHVICLHGGWKHEPEYRLARLSFPLATVSYWTKDKVDYA